MAQDCYLLYSDEGRGRLDVSAGKSVSQHVIYDCTARAAPKVQ